MSDDNVPEKKKTSVEGEANERIFQIPPGCDVSELAGDLAAWLESDQEKACETRAIEGGWLIQARDTGGMLKKLVARKADRMHVVLTPGKDRLRVKFAHGKWTKSHGKTGAGKFSVRDAAAFALDTASSLSDAASSGISSLLVETKTSEAVFDYIGRRIAAVFRAEEEAEGAGIDAFESRYVEPMSSVESTWLAGFRKPDEPVLAWLATSTEVPDAKNEEWRYLLTSRRAALVAFSKTCFIRIEELPHAPMAVTDSIGRDVVTVGDATWRTQLFNDVLFREIVPLSELGPEERLLEAARLNYLNRDKDETHLPYAASVLNHLAAISDDPVCALSRVYMEETQGKEPGAGGGFEGMDPSPEFTEVLQNVSSGASPERLRQWADSWKAPARDRIALSALILDLNPASPPHAETIHPLLTEAAAQVKKEEKNKTLHVLADIHLARCLGQLGRHGEAVEILENRLSELPDETLSDLLPTRDADLTKGEGGQLIKVRILELLVEHRGIPDTDDIGTLRRLAVLQPLVPRRLERLRNAGDADIRRLASAPFRLLAKDGLAPNEKEGGAPEGKASRLTSDDIENKLRHPASREGAAMRKIQNYLAAKNVPDHDALKSYAKRITADNRPDLASALTDGPLLLDMKTVEAYISFGDLNIGVRGHDGNPPFILVGAEHLEAGSPFHMNLPELTFLIGGELAHIKFKHERITSREVWEGVFDKAFSIVELVPVLGGWLGKLGAFGKFAGKASDIAKKAGDIQGYIGQARDLASSARDLHRRPARGALSRSLDSDKRDLISAFRVMQLTADRAALVLCGDLKAAVRAIFKSTPVLNVELSAAERMGLDEFLSRVNDEGELMFQDLAIRVAALFSFYLSEDYATLRAAAFSNSRPGSTLIDE